MADKDFPLSRRTLIGAASTMAAASLLPGVGTAQSAAKESGAQMTLGLRVIANELQIAPRLPPSEVWELVSDQPDAAIRYTRGDLLTVLVKNEITVPITLNWLGFDGTQSFEPLTGVPTTPPGSQARMTTALRQSGSFLIDPRLLADGLDRPLTPRSFVVEGAKTSGAERDELLFIEDWRIKPDGTALSAGRDPGDATTVYTVNRRAFRDIRLQQNDRLRLRIINASQRTPIGLKIEKFDVRVVSIDSQPAESFIAREGRVVLAPGSRVTALIDASLPQGTVSDIVIHDGSGPRTIGRLTITDQPPDRPLQPAPSLPAANLPAQIDFKSAMRVELQLDAKEPWIAPVDFQTTSAPVMQVKRNRAVIMAITNPTAAPVTFRLHGHHFRLLDRLDDGWKPFWLDTLLVDARQTQRIAFLAEYPGQWLIEACGIDWSARRMVRFFSVG